MEQMRVGGGRWREAPRVAKVVEKLTPECRDLLEKVRGGRGASILQ